MYDGQVKTLTFDDAIAKYNEIRMKYVNNHTDFTDEEKLLVKYDPTDYEQRGMYQNFLVDKTAVKPIGDLLDYLLNDCLCGITYDYETQGDKIDKDYAYNGYLYDTDYRDEYYGTEDKDGLRDIFGKHFIEKYGRRTGASANPCTVPSG